MAEGRARNKRLAALAAGVGATAAAAAAAAAAGGRPPTISERRAAELEAKLGGCSFLFSNDGADSYAVLTPPRFDLADEDAAAAAMSYLDEFGYLVVAAAAPPAALQRLRSLLWLELEALGRGIRRDDPATWHGFPTEPFAQSTVGLYVGCGLGQSEVMWTARALPGVRRPFELIWGTKELISSMDGLTMFRPVSHDPSWRTANGWWHATRAVPSLAGTQCRGSCCWSARARTRAGSASCLNRTTGLRQRCGERLTGWARKTLSPSLLATRCSQTARPLSCVQRLGI